MIDLNLFDHLNQALTMTNTVKYVTIVDPVLEVTLIGTASLATWRPQLETEGLTIATAEVHIVLSAVETRYIGVRFKEFSVSLLLDEHQVLLLHAFNSNRMFAWVERQFFHTPYYHGDIDVQENHIAIREQSHPLIEVSLPDNATVSRSGDEDIERVVLMKRSSRSVKRPYFHARLEGHTRYFDATGSTLHYFDSTQLNPTLSTLRQSDFRLQDWSVRCHARHSKSNTYQQE